MTYSLDEIDRRIVAATQAGLPIIARPYDEIAAAIGVTPSEMMTRMDHMLSAGAIRRIGAVPNHYKLGYTANGMSVWDVADEEITDAGRQIGAFDFVSHCYQRPRHPPHWPYNLFAMVHGKSRNEVAAKVERIAVALGSRARGHQVLLSTRILKKTGLRLVA